MTDTSTPGAARAHARAQAGRTADAMPIVPASDWPTPPEGVAASALTWAETIATGGYAAKGLARGTHLRLADPGGDACAHLLLFNARQPWERLNVADTVKVPWQAYLGTGHPLLSDQGRALATIVEDTSGCHDALCGTSNRARNERRYGDGTPHGASPAGRELFLLGALKHGLGPRDVAPSVSFFKAVRVQPDGALRFDGAVQAGTHLVLRLELECLAIVVNVPHPLDPREAYAGTTLEVLAWAGSPTAADDPLTSASPELGRALANSRDYAEALA